MKYKAFGSLAILFIAVIAAHIKSGQVMTCSVQKTNTSQQVSMCCNNPDDRMYFVDLPPALPVVTSDTFVLPDDPSTANILHFESLFSGQILSK